MTNSPSEEMECLLAGLRRLAAGSRTCRDAAASEMLDPLRVLVGLCDVNERLVRLVADAQAVDWAPPNVTPQLAAVVERAAATLAVNGVWLKT